MTHRIAELTAPEVAARLAAGACAILPMGSLETHGPQAPMGDFLLAEAIADRIAAAAAGQGVDALVLPAIPFGGEDYFGFTPGGVVLTPALLQAVVEEVCGNLLRTGCRRILIVNGHAGSIGPVDAAARMLRRRHDVLIPAMHLWRAAGALHAELGGAPESFGHGGDPVWSVALHLRPDLCRPERARARQPVGPVLGLPVADFGTVRVAGVEPLGADGGRGGRPRRRRLRRQPPRQCRARRPHHRPAGRGRRRHALPPEGRHAMKVCVYGAGAIGGHIAARLAKGGAEVSLVARGPHLAAIQAKGLTVHARDGVLHSRPRASADPAELGPQDAVIVTTKAPALPSVAAGIAPLLGPDTPVAFVMNGIPWWYNDATARDGQHLRRSTPAVHCAAPSASAAPSAAWSIRRRPSPSPAWSWSRPATPASSSARSTAASPRAPRRSPPPSPPAACRRRWCRTSARRSGRSCSAT